MTERFQRHSTLWLDDGNVLISGGQIGYKLHRSFLCRLSPSLGKRVEQTGDFYEGLPWIRLTRDQADEGDLETFFQYLYHDKPLCVNPSFNDNASLLRISTKLEFPGILEISRQRLREIYALRPAPFECTEWPNVPEACQLALDYNLRELLPSLLYAMIVTIEFDMEGDDSISSTPPTSTAKSNVYRLCSRVMQQLVNYFTPVFFTVPTGSHMACTDTLATHWMDLAIQPSIQNGGVYKPFETLQRIQEIEWKTLGLCDECYQEKIEEWEEQADIVWTKIQQWIDDELRKL